jgi:hypothetical protein
LRTLMRDVEVAVVGADGGPASANLLCPPDCEIECKLFAMTYGVKSAVIAHAVQASRPKYAIDPLKPRAKIGCDGRVKLEGTNWGGRYSKGAFTWLEYSRPTIENFLFARASYRIWLDALHSLAGELAGKLEQHEPLPPAAAFEPWITGEPLASRAIPSLVPVSSITPTVRPRTAPPAPSYRLGKAVPRAA